MKNRFIREDMLATSSQQRTLAQTTGSRVNISADVGRMVRRNETKTETKTGFLGGSRQLMMSTVAFLTNYQRGPLAREFSREIKRGIPIEGVQPRISAQSQNGRVIIGGGRKLLNLSLLGKLQATQATPPGPMLALALISEALDATK
jgi:hypothetical protein